MRRYIGRNVSASDRFDWKPHGKQAVRIFPENFPVQKVPPPANHLSEHQSRHTDIAKLQKVHLLYPAVYIQCDKRRNDGSVNRQTAVPQVQDFQQIILIHIPLENDIVYPRADNRKNQGIQDEVPYNVRIFLFQFGHMGRHKHAAQHAKSNHYAIQRNLESENTE